MTHTLHPEIIDDIVNSMNHYVDEHMYHALGMKKVLEKHLGPYLLPPSQHLKDKDVGMTYCPFRDEYIDTPEHCVKEDNEPLPEQSTPKIERMDYKMLDMIELQQKVFDKLNEIIDYINNKD